LALPFLYSVDVQIPLATPSRHHAATTTTAFLTTTRLL